MKRFAWIAIILLVLAIPFTLAVTQEEETITLDIIGVDPTDLSAVTVNTSVLDAKGQLVSGLGVDDFSVGGDLEDIATVVKVENVTDDNLAFASVLVIDTSSSMSGPPLQSAQEAARNYIGALGVNDPVAIVSFNSTVQLVQDYTTDKTLLLNAIDNVAFGGTTALYDATLRSIEIANNAPLPRRAVVVLSDGGEYGTGPDVPASTSTREDSIQASTVSGVPVYTIGLGWNVDRRFLESIASESNAGFFESPSPDELLAIYDNLAFLFRSQYIVTLDVPVAEDGTRYDFSLEATTADGLSASDTATLRAPVPVPVLSFPADIFTEALTDTTVVTANVVADDEIASVEYLIGETVVSTTESYTIEPATTAPGAYTLDVRVTDVDGDVGTVSADFEIAALAPTLASDFAPEAGTSLSEPTVITVDAGGQTDITEVEFVIDNVVVATDTEAPFEYTLDPFTLSPEGHILTIRATNAGEQTSSFDTAFTVATLPPRIDVSGLSDETVLTDNLSLTVVAVGQSTISSITVNQGETELASATDFDTVGFGVNALDFEPGTASIDVTAVDANGATTTQTFSFAVAALPPTVDISGLTADEVITGDVTVTVTGGGQTEVTLIDVAYDGGVAETILGTSFTVPANSLGDGEHDVTVIVTNSGGQSTSVDIPFVVSLPPTPTFTPEPTNTLAPTDTVEPTDTSEPTDTVEPTDTSEPTDTDEPTATSTVEPTATGTPNPTETAEAAAQISEEETQSVEETTVAEETQTALDATDAAEEEATVDAQSTQDEMSTQAADDALATANARSTQQQLDLTSTAEAEEGEANATASVEAEEAANTEATEAAEEEEATDTASNVEATDTDEEGDATEAPTEDDSSEEPTDEPTDEPLPTSTDSPTEDGVEDPTAQPTLTPVTITEVDAQSADAQDSTGDNTTILAIGVGLLVLLFAFFFVRRRGNN